MVEGVTEQGSRSRTVVQVTAPSRLHFGLFSFGHREGRPDAAVDQLRPAMFAVEAIAEPESGEELVPSGVEAW